MGTQARFTSRMLALAERASVTLTVDADWANTGTYRFTPADSFAPVLTVDYDFQHGYARFKLKGANELEIAANAGSPSCFVGYRSFDSERLDEAVKMIEDCLPSPEVRS